VGVARVAAGGGSLPLHLDSGRVYLAGPYHGAPLSLVALVPAVAGPFDLGTVAVRMALHVDPVTARLRAISDPFPTILRGVPLDLRALQIDLNRPGFIRNPTSCDEMSVLGSATSAAGATAALAYRFQVGGCADLGFKPTVTAQLVGPTHRGAHPGLRTVLRARGGDASIRRVVVALPPTELLDNRRIKAVCPRPRYAARNCPDEAAVGFARAWSPLLDQPLAGPVYLRAGKHRLPDLAVSLDGQFRLDLAARIDSVRGRLRMTLQALPDVPLSRVVVSLPGGRGGLIVNSGGLCAERWRTAASFLAHNGKTRDVIPVLRTHCGRRSAPAD